MLQLWIKKRTFLFEPLISQKPWGKKRKSNEKKKKSLLTVKELVKKIVKIIV